MHAFYMYAGSAFDNSVTFTFDLLTCRATTMRCTVCVPSLVFTARAVYILEGGHINGHTHTETSQFTIPMH